MKTFFKAFASFIAIAAAFASCNKNEDIVVPAKDNLIHFSLNAQKIETKTALVNMGSGSWMPIWQSTDTLGVLASIPTVDANANLNADGALSATISGDGYTAEFSGTVNVEESADQTLYGVVPASAIKKIYKTGGVGLDVLEEQTAVIAEDGTYVLPGDVLISKPVSFTIVDNEGVANGDLFFKRITSTVKLNLKFPSNAACSGESILSVQMKAAKAYLSGRVSVKLETGEILAVNTKGDDPTSVKVDISALNQKATTSVPVFVSVAPVEMKSSDGSIVFEIETENFKIKKIVAGKNLAFESSQIYSIGLDLTASDDCVYTDKREVTTDPTVATVGKNTISINSDLYGVSNGSTGTEQSVWTSSGVKIVSGCSSTASTKTYYDASHIRYYAGSYMKLSVPSGYEIVKVVFSADGKWDGGITTNNVGTYTNETKTWAGRSTSVDFAFSNQCRVASIVVSVVETGENPEPEKLEMTSIRCTSKTTSSITFSWNAVSNTLGYQVKINDGEYGSTQAATSYTCSDLDPEEEVTIYVKAIGDGTEYLTSEPASLTESTNPSGIDNVTVTEFQWSVSGSTESYTSGFTVASNLKAAGSGYRQDQSTAGETYYISLYNKNTPIFSENPGTVKVTAKIGGGTANKTLSSPIYFCLVDKDGAEISNTSKAITSTITTAAGDTYTEITLSVPESVTTAYGVKIYHVKTASYNCRFYSFSVKK